MDKYTGKQVFNKEKIKKKGLVAIEFTIITEF
jgi:hypothetical protein